MQEILNLDTSTEYNWTYRDVDIILEESKNMGSLHLGNIKAAQDIEYFNKYNIKCVLTVANSYYLS